MSRPADPNAKIDLLRAAEAVFVERGVDQAKVEEITGRAGHSKGAFYLHFGSKEDAFRQIVETVLARLATCLDESEALTAISTLETAEYLAYWRVKDLEMFEFIWANRGVMRLMLEGGRSAAFGYLIDQFAERTREQAKRGLQLGVRQGLFRADLDVDLASMFIAGGYDRVVRELVRKERKPPLRPIIEQLQRISLAGLATPRFRAVIDSGVKNGRSRSKHPRPAVRSRSA
jgi:AcrR family transcriptional regulator